MNYVDFGIIRSVVSLLADFSAHREELRTERYLNSLPEEVLKDIGWPDVYAERLARRGSMKEDHTDSVLPEVDLPPWQLGWPKRREPQKASKSSYFRLEY